MLMSAGLVLVSLSPVVARADAQQTALPANTPTDPFTAAVNDYVGAASKEMSAIRDEVVANEKAGKKVRFAPVRSGLEKCQALIPKLKTASQNEFDAVKAEYERLRGELLQKLDTARKG